MFVVEVVGGVIAVFAVALLLAAVGGGLPAAPPDTDEPALPTDRLLTSSDIARLRFRIGLRGYRMEDVDAAMAAVHASLWAAETKAAETDAAETKTADTAAPDDGALQ